MSKIETIDPATLSEAELKLWDQVKETIETITIDRLHVDKEQVKELGAHFRNDLGADSMDQWELAIDFGDKLRISIPPRVERNINTIHDAVSYIYSVKKLEM